MKKIIVLILVLVINHSLCSKLKVGEKLFYHLRFSGLFWLDIDAGYAMVEIKKKLQFKNRDTFLFQSKLTSKDTGIDRIFKVRDQITSYWDIQKQQPLRTILDLKEGRYFRHYIVDFNLRSLSANYKLKEFKGNTNKFGVANTKAKWKYSNGEITNLPPGFQDILGSFYKMRLDPRRGKPGTKFFLNVVTDKKQAKLEMTVINFEKIRVQSGEFNTIKVRPYVRGVKFFESYGKVYVWVSDDQNRYPVKIEAQVPLVGKITAELIRITH